MFKKIRSSVVCVVFCTDFFMYGQTGTLQHGSASDSIVAYGDAQSVQLYPACLPQGHVQVLVVPHTNHPLAQVLMTAAYKTVQHQHVDTVIIIASAPQNSLYGIALPVRHDLSVLGPRSLLCASFIEQLVQHRLVHYYQTPFHDAVHLSLQYDFCTLYLKDVSIVPIVVGTISYEDASEIARLFASCCTNDILLVISADIGHYTQCKKDSPLDQSKNCFVYNKDSFLIQAIQSFSVAQAVNLCSDLEKKPIFSLLFHVLEMPYFTQRLSYFIGYETSCYDTSAVENIQSFASFMFQKHVRGPENYMSAYEEKQLMMIARQKLDSLFKVQLERIPCLMSYEMLQPHGLFASLYSMTDHGILLRGCIGRVHTKLPLITVVEHMVEQAAMKDSRFYPMRHKEAQNTIISLSLITDVKRVHDVEIIHELDGIMLQYDDKDAVVLPLPYPTIEWSYDTALAQLSERMGMSSLAWKKPRAVIFTFRAQVFQEE